MPFSRSMPLLVHHQVCLSSYVAQPAAQVQCLSTKPQRHMRDMLLECLFVEARQLEMAVAALVVAP